jgi:hypothetical protein
MMLRACHLDSLPGRRGLCPGRAIVPAGAGLDFRYPPRQAKHPAVPGVSGLSLIQLFPGHRGV